MRELSLKNCRLDGRYDIQETLGQGSYAEIYVARDTLASPQSPHSLVVIKALNVFLQNDLDHDLERTLVENFQNEAVALDRVRHPARTRLGARFEKYGFSLSRFGISARRRFGESLPRNGFDVETGSVLSRTSVRRTRTRA